jgi:GNAT superfamily N-acetyltransferase
MSGPDSPAVHSWTLIDDVVKSDVGYLRDRINEYNFAAAGIYDGRELAVFARDKRDEIVSGLYGWTWGQCLYIEFLWVQEDLRGQGYGSKLLRDAEQEAIKRGCQVAALSTHSFQAPEFYKKYGYQVVGATNDYPRGHQHIYLSKNLKS